MWKILDLIFCFCLFLAALSCTENRNVYPLYPEKEIIIDYRNQVNRDSLDTKLYFHNRQLIELEATKESLISQINRLIFYKNRIYILDISTNSVFIFNDNGKYISKIKRIGRGPAEYIELSDCALDTEKDQIILLCTNPECMLFFDLPLNFIRQEKVEKFSKYLSISYNRIYYLNFLTNDNKYYIGEKGEGKYSEFLPIEDFFRDRIFYVEHPDIVKSKSTYFYKTYDDNIYEFKKDSISLKYHLDFGGRFITRRKIEEYGTNSELLSYCIKESIVSRISDFRDYDNYLVFNTFPDKKITIYDKNEKRAKIFPYFYDSEIGLYLNDYIAQDGEGNELIFQISSESFVQNVLNIKNPEKYSQNENYIKVKELANRLTPNDNPLLVVYRLNL